MSIIRIEKVCAFLLRCFWRFIWDKRSSSPNLLVTRGAAGSNLGEFEETIEYICQLLEFENEDAFLDVGCGVGYVLNRFAPLVSSVTGIDLSGQMVRQAKKNLKGQPNTNIFQSGATSISQPDCSFTKILCYSVVHYFSSKKDLELMLFEFNRLLKPGGKVLIGDIPEIGMDLYPTATSPGWFKKVLSRIVSPTIHTRYSKTEVLLLVEKCALEGKVVNQPDTLLHTGRRFDVVIDKLN